MYSSAYRVCILSLFALSFNAPAHASGRVGLASQPLAGCQFSSIAAALGAALPADTVYALPDNYLGENWGLLAKNVTVTPAPPDSNCTTEDPTQTLNIQAGGASLVELIGTLNLKHSVVIDGTDSQVVVTGGELNLVDTQLRGDPSICKVSSPGGLLHVSDGGEATLDAASAMVDSCIDAEGGAAYVTDEGSSLTVDGGRVSRNSSATQGGGVSVVNGASLDIRNMALISGNTTTGSGGGVRVGPESSLTTSSLMGDVRFLNNQAMWLGGGVDVRGSASLRDTTFMNNVAFDGGGISYVESNLLGIQLFSLTDSLVLDNRTLPGGTGGGLFVEGEAFPFPVPTVTGTRIAYNTAGIGAGITIYHTHLVITDSEIDQNQSFIHSGGIFLNDGALSATDSSINGNSTYPTGPMIPGGWGGGGVMCGLGGELYLTRATVEDNTIGLAQGGGILAVNCDAVLIDTVVAGNTSGLRGGGLALDTSSAYVEVKGDSQIERNEANRGGGISITGGGRIELTDGVVNRNLANLEGGGAFLDDLSAGSNPVLTSSSTDWGGSGFNDNVPHDIFIFGAPLSPFDYTGPSSFICSAATNDCL